MFRARTCEQVPNRTSAGSRQATNEEQDHHDVDDHDGVANLADNHPDGDHWYLSLVFDWIGFLNSLRFLMNSAIMHFRQQPIAVGLGTNSANGISGLQL